MRFRKLAVSVAVAMVCGLVLTFLSATVFAAGSITVDTSSLTLYVGQTGSIKVTASNAAGRVDWSSSGAVTGSGSVWVEKGSKNINVLAASTGSGTVTIKLRDAATFDKQELTGTYTVQVTVKEARTLYNGMTGSDVLFVQTRLAEMGYPVGDLDGIFGGMTEAAVMQYQQDHGLYVDGVVGPQTMGALGPASGPANSNDPDRSLSNGMTGDDVYELQAALADLGYRVGDIDGIFGNMTEAAVRAFQTDNGLYVDGVAGPQTMGVLFSSSASSSSGSSSSSSGDIGPLSRGSSGDAVYRMQAALANLGYPVGDLDGMFGGMTEAAVIAFQSDYGLYVDGVAGPQTLGALGISSSSSGSSSSSSRSASFDRAMSMGMTGNDIAAMQEVLSRMGYPVGAVDGEFGSMTQAAVIAFQADYGLDTDGVAGPLTQAAMGLR